jgi:hypothetical protein
LEWQRIYSVLSVRSLQEFHTRFWVLDQSFYLHVQLKRQNNQSHGGQTRLGRVRARCPAFHTITITPSTLCVMLGALRSTCWRKVGSQSLLLLFLTTFVGTRLVVALKEGTTSLPQRTSRSLTQGMVAGIVALPITQERKEVKIPTLFSTAKRLAHYSSARGCVGRLDGRPTSAMDTRPQQTIDQVPPTSQGLVALVNPPPPAFLESSFNFEGASTVVTTNVKTLYFDQGHIELWPTLYFDQGC